MGLKIRRVRFGSLWVSLFEVVCGDVGVEIKHPSRRYSWSHDSAVWAGIWGDTPTIGHDQPGARQCFFKFVLHLFLYYSVVDP